MRLVLNVYNSPAVFPSAHGLATNDYVLLGSDHREWNHVPNTLVKLHFLFIILVGIEWIESDAVVEEFCPDLLLERFALLQSETVGLGNNGNNIDNFA